MTNLNGSKVLVTGGTSMLAKAVVPLLYQRNVKVVISERHFCDLTSKEETEKYLENCQPDYVIHLAGLNSNIQGNIDRPATIFYATSLINLNVINACIKYKVKKVISPLSSCAYPANIDVLTEGDLWRSAPHHTVECHAIAKRLLDVYSRFARKQNSLNAVTVVINNLFGPNDWFTEKGKVVSSFIRKYVEAKQQDLPSVTNWGKGVEKRELTYTPDAANALVQALEKYDEAVPLNIASGYETTIKNLAKKVSDLVGYDGETLWDETKPDGQMRKKLDITRMKHYLDVKFTDFDLALKETIDWYISNKELADNRKIQW